MSIGGLVTTDLKRPLPRSDRTYGTEASSRVAAEAAAAGYDKSKIRMMKATAKRWLNPEPVWQLQQKSSADHMQRFIPEHDSLLCLLLLLPPLLLLQLLMQRLLCVVFQAPSDLVSPAKKTTDPADTWLELCYSRPSYTLRKCVAIFKHVQSNV